MRDLISLRTVLACPGQENRGCQRARAGSGTTRAARHAASAIGGNHKPPWAGRSLQRPAIVVRVPVLVAGRINGRELGSALVARSHPVTTPAHQQAPADLL